MGISEGLEDGDLGALEGGEADGALKIARGKITDLGVDEGCNGISSRSWNLELELDPV